MYRFKKIEVNIYRYRGVDVKIHFDEYNNASMLAQVTEDSGDPAQFYSYGPDFDKVKQSIIQKIDEHLENSSNEKA